MIKYLLIPSYLTAGAGECIPDCDNNPIIKQRHEFTWSRKIEILFKTRFYLMLWLMGESFANLCLFARLFL